MNVLLTGASSFTGFWFARALVAAGHRVIPPLRGRVDGYEGVRGERAKRLAGLVTVIEGCPFGSAAFLSLVCGDAWDLFAHHGAATANYRSADFDVVGALAENTSGLPALLRSFQEAGGRGVLLTGSVFEQDEGVGNAPIGRLLPLWLIQGSDSAGISLLVRRARCAAREIRHSESVRPV